MAHPPPPGSGSSPEPRRPNGSVDLPPIEVEGGPDECPNCHSPMAREAVVCMQCGFDQRAGVLRSSKPQDVVGPAEEVEDERPAPEFVRPGLGTPKVLAIVGGVLTVGAMIAAAINAPGGTLLGAAASAAAALYLALLHTGTGMVAVVLAARVQEERITRLDLAASRLLCCVALFVLLTRVFPPGTWWMLLAYPLAAAAYFGVLTLLFKRTQSVTALLALFHAVLWLLVQLGVALEAWSRAAASAGTTP